MNIYKLVCSLTDKFEISEWKWKLVEERNTYYKIDSGVTKIQLKKTDLNRVTQTLHMLDLEVQVFCTEELLETFRRDLPSIYKQEVRKMISLLQNKLEKLP
ncbi:hypothetical protein [Paenibacillus polymyxa]|uniref:Uncharacterized protein n=1 Tax=Paenibacillus polymyxa (strain SC2) TaxID=886882 RepID=E3EJS6_PAEPS|nr:hypothetical protein [Paenibacillus polymyxa]ADO59674.1 hypothetical protein PPSC2_26740 [Paenibacillus polymyxa SC2]WPQ59500.1 hypothetical protein SKN87_27955 [Paenibacillus polymyxa]